ncbi:hypothetical protein Q5P01_015636 [Channa striata]|uniref:DEP domain-containing protein n=1 Tax=Channa striata TaxID=64152 RepID=A0AA88SIZ0_CHASR|nr:hypothetical protein Q5P01_015636 [Channa striata]
MSSHVITPGPYRATKLWNEVTRLFRAGMPLRKHRQNFRHHASCFTASAAVDWLHQLLCSNSNFGPDVTRQQTVQLLKKFLKNHVIEDVKGRWGSEDLEDNNVLYRFPSSSPLKPIPCPAPASGPGSIKKRPSLRDKEGFFKFKSVKKQEKETLENLDPASVQAQGEGGDQPRGEPEVQRRELTVQDEHDIWRDITLTHLQRILGIASLDEVLDQRYVNPQNIIHNMTKVSKHGVVTLDDKTNDLPHWVLSAMKSLASWPKYDSGQPSYPGFERDVFKTVSDYFYSLPQPLLTYELYELFINVLVFCGYVAAPAVHQRGKRKKPDLPSVPPPAKTSFRSTECLLLSLIRQGTCDETESPMREVLGGKLQSRLVAVNVGRAGGSFLGGSCSSLSTVVSMKPQTRSCSLETILDVSVPFSQQQQFLSNDSLASGANISCSQDDSSAFIPHSGLDFTSVSRPASVTCEKAPAVAIRQRLSSVSMAGVSGSQRLRPRSVGSCLDIVTETREEEVNETKWQGRATSCLNVNAPADQHCSSSASRASSSSYHPSSTSFCHSVATYSSSASAKAQGSHAATGPCGPRPAASTSNLWTLRAPAAVRRCLSSLDVSKSSGPVSLFKPPVCVPASSSQSPQHKPEHSLLQPHCERLAIEALQLCTLLLPPPSAGSCNCS